MTPVRDCNRIGVKAAAIAAAVSAAMVTVAAGPALSQVAEGAFPSGKRCQVVRTCNFSRGGSYRGCLSSYSCRQCRFVMENCRIGGATGRCRKLKCSWGGR